MAQLLNPVLFSKRFKIAPSDLEIAGLLDPILNSDTRLFIDPLLIPQSKNKIIRTRGPKLMEAGFKRVMELVDVSETEGDVAWKGAFNKFNLDERPETGLGYGGASRSGNSRSAKLRTSLLRTAKQIMTLGVKQPSVVPNLALFERDVGPDTISDMTTNQILPALCEVTEQFCTRHKVKTKKWGKKYDGRELPENPFRTNEPVLLVPRDILRDLPLAADWSEVPKVIMEVAEIRDAVNAHIGNWNKATVSHKKAAIRRAALEDVEILKKVLRVLVGASEPYDEKLDLDGQFSFRRVLSGKTAEFKGLVSKPNAQNQATLQATVRDIIKAFRDMVEKNNLWELLWYGETPRKERAAQLLFFAVANVICAANDLDISPETNSGGGPVDFKFSKGFHGRVLVEVKLSKGRVEHGYAKQLEVYKNAANNAAGIFLVIDVGGMGQKLKKIRKAKSEADAAGGTASDIEYVNAFPKKSASKV